MSKSAGRFSPNPVWDIFITRCQAIDVFRRIEATYGLGCRRQQTDLLLGSQFLQKFY
jgi:hypothetical protein